MRTLLAITCLALAAAGQVPTGAAGTVVDGIAAVVDGQPVLRSEVEEAAWYARFSQDLGHAGAAAPVGLTAAEKQTALQHLVDEQLLREAAANEGFAAPAPETLDADVQTQWAHLAAVAGGDGALAAALAAHHLGRAAVAAQLRQQLTLVEFLDQHFSGSAAPTPEQIRLYYDATFVPAARQRQQTPAPLAQVRAAIAALLREQQRDAAEQQWLVELRSHAAVGMRQPW